MPGSRQFTLGPYRLDADTGELARGDVTVKLTPKAAAVLKLLGEQPGRLVGKRELFAKVWAGRVVSDAALTSCIQEIRAALQDDPKQPRFIQTLHRRGYRLLVPLVRAAPPRAVGPAFVGREAELRELERRLERARAGERQVVFVAGEAGIGKTTLIDAFVASAVRDRELIYAVGGCAEHYGASEPYRPLLDALAGIARGPHGEAVLEILRRCAPSWLAQLPALLDDTELERLRLRVLGATRERMLRELADAMAELCAAHPVLLRLEDLHWSDVSTLDWLGFIARRTEPARLLVVASIRFAEALPRDHPLAAMRAELPLVPSCSVLELAPLAPHEVGEYLQHRLAADGAAIDVAALAATIHARTEGNPLFMVTVTNDLVARGALTCANGAWTLDVPTDAIGSAIPADLRRLIDLQLDRLDERARTVLRAASAAGAQFSAAAVAAALGEPVAEIEQCCAELARRGQFLDAAGAETWPDGTLASKYAFRHALYREALYGSVPAATCAAWHARLGDRLEAAFGAGAPAAFGAGARAQAAELAAHFDRGRDFGRAVLYHHAAGDNASRRNAPREAVTHYRRAIELLAELPDSHQRALREIELNIALGPALLASRGWGAAEAEQAYARAQELCARTGATKELFTALWGLWMYRWGHGELGDALTLGRQLLELAERTADDALHLQAHHALWATALPRGELAACVEHAAAGEGEYVPARHAALAARFGSHDAGACAAQFHAWALALRGDIEGARASAARALELTGELSQPFSHALALFFAAGLHLLLREPEAAESYAQAATEVAAEHGFKLVEAWSSAVAGWSATLGGNHAGGLQSITDSIQAARTTGTQQFQTLLFMVLADACRHAGRVHDGAAAASAGLELAERTGERFCEAELRRLQAELEIAGADPPRAAERAGPLLEQALATAREQGAHLFEMRAAVSLMRVHGGADSAVRAALGRVQAGCADAADARAALEASRS